MKRSHCLRSKKKCVAFAAISVIVLLILVVLMELDLYHEVFELKQLKSHVITTRREQMKRDITYCRTILSKYFEKVTRLVYKSGKSNLRRVEVTQQTKLEKFYYYDLYETGLDSSSDDDLTAERQFFHNDDDYWKL